MEAILIRHGITNGNIEKRYIGTTDEPLIDSEKERLRKNIYPDADIIIISPMKRCIPVSYTHLAGDAWYFGKLYKKDYIGDPIKPIKCENILEVNKLMYISAFISIVLFTSLKLIILGGM